MSSSLRFRSPKTQRPGILQTYELRDFYQLVGEARYLALLADAEDARYEVEGRGDPSATKEQVREMVKGLLADRFQLKVHHETRDLPMYALIPAKGGIKLQAAKDDGKSRVRGFFSFMDKGWIQGHAVQMTILVQLLTGNTDRPVIDKTGFTEPFDFRLTWTPDTGPLADATRDGLCPAASRKGSRSWG